jgi:hypothetical protein
MIRIRRLMIKTAEIMMIVLVVVMVISSAISGAAAGGNAGGIILGFIGLIVGGLLGLVTSAVIASFFFLILEIAENTRRVLRYYEPADATLQQR